MTKDESTLWKVRWSSGHESAFGAFRSLAQKHGGRRMLNSIIGGGSLVVGEKEMMGSALMALFIINCPGVIIGLNDREVEWAIGDAGLSLLAHTGAYLRTVN